MSFKYHDRMCFERYTSKNGAWKLDELLADKNVLSVIKKYGVKKTKKDICEKLEEILRKEGKPKAKKRIPIEVETDSEEEIIEEKSDVKNKLIQKCQIYSECPRGYTRKNLVDLAIECGVSVKDGKKSANMKMICENMKKRYGFKEDDLPPKKTKPKGRNCKNRETAISMTDVDDIENIKYIRLSNGYCYDIDELVQTMIMSKDRNINPSDPSNLTPIWMNEVEKESIINHEGLDKSIRKSYKAMIDIEKKSEEKILESIANDSPVILNKIAETGFHCLNDNITSWSVDDPELFQKAQKMLIELRDTIRKSKLKLFYERMHVGMIELGTTLDNAHLECIHGVGLKLLTIYCTFYYRVSRIKSLKLSPFVYPITKGGKEFIVAGMESDPTKKGRVKNFYLKSISVDNSFAKNIGKYSYDSYNKDYVVLSDLDSTPDWIKYLKKNKEILVQFFSQLQSVSPKKMIPPEKDEKISTPKPKMSKKIVAIEFASDSEGEEESSEVCDFYDSIDNKYKIFSNYADTPVKIDGVVWPTTEHYYHAQKFVPSDDEDISWYQEKIRMASTANKSKMLGNQKVTGRFGAGTFLSPADKTPLKDIIDESKERGVSMRKDWEKVKDSVMYKAVKTKLEQHAQVKKTLLATGTCVIREASPTDLYWGIGREGKGKNMLGITYMKLRDEYRGVKKTMDDYKKMTESTKGVALTEGSKSKSKGKSSTRAFDVASKLEGLPKDVSKFKSYYQKLGGEVRDLLGDEDLNKYNISELKYLIQFFNNSMILDKVEKYTYTGKKKADFVTDLKSFMKAKRSKNDVTDKESDVDEEVEIESEEEFEDPTENKIKTVNGDLLSYVKTHYIVHQCNAVTDKGKGIAETIFKKFPKADIYSDGTKRKLGDVFIRGKIINLVGQHYPGVAKYANDTVEKRISAFKRGLETIAKKIPSDSSVAFPYNIGCGLAKGDWKVYKGMIQDFADKNKDLKVLLVKYDAKNEDEDE